MSRAVLKFNFRGDLTRVDRYIYNSHRIKYNNFEKG